MEIKKLASATALALLLMTGAAAAQTGSTTDTTGTYSATDTSGTAGTGATVGTPNTGAGGDMAMNAMLLTGAGAIALGGAAVLARKRSI
jgi:hypothetical protein